MSSADADLQLTQHNNSLKMATKIAIFVYRVAQKMWLRKLATLVFLPELFQQIKMAPCNAMELFSPLTTTSGHSNLT